MPIADDQYAAVDTFLLACFNALGDTAEGFTCQEADSIAEVYRSFGHAEKAEEFLEMHGRGDEDPADVDTNDYHFGYKRTDTP